MNNMKNFEEEIFNWPLYCDRKLDEKNSSITNITKRLNFNFSFKIVCSFSNAKLSFN